MLKTRKKSLSLLVTLAFLFTMILPGLAFGAVEYVKVTSSYTYVDADDEQDVGIITISAGDDYDSNVVDAVYAEITLPDGVEFTDTDKIAGNIAVIGSTDTSFVCTLDNKEEEFSNSINVDKLDIDSDVSGDIDAAVRVWAVQGSTIRFDETFNVTIAKVSSGDVTVSAASAKTLTVGSNKTGAKITIKELSPGALSTANDGDIFLTIKASGVKWDTEKMTDDMVNTMGLTLNSINADDDYSNSDKTLHLTVASESTTMNGKIEITPKFVVQPGASGDVVVKVSGDDIDSVELTVGQIGQGVVDVEVEKADKDTVYLGQLKKLDEVKVTLDPATEIDEDDYITITLPKGLKWPDPDDWSDISDVSGIIEISDNNVSINSLYNNDRSIWLDLENAQDDDFELSNFQIVADYNAEVGDLEITFGGAVEGTYKIGSVKAPFTVTTEAVNLPLRGSDVAGNKIVITETAAGAILATDDDADNDAAPDALDIILPMGLSFASTPDVDVVDGDLELGDVGVVDDDTLRIQIKTKSNLASTIEITDLFYNVDNRAAEGDAVAKVGGEFNMASNNYLATVKIGKVVSAASVLESAFVIGSSTYTIDGVEKTMDVAPYIKGDRTYLPIRYVAYALGIKDSNILWDGVNQTVTLMKGDKVVQLKIGSTALMINGATVTMDVAPEITSDRTMLPIRFVAQAFGATVSWDAATQTVTIE
ncbi:MAG: copper amine oxidase N-terminal domain-containing protein [Syntrophomonadaceae bacterium]|nr:copper amine oxidase N-terminal domain-containing protein [Syntrophomonadaceae bacterium]